MRGRRLFWRLGLLLLAAIGGYLIAVWMYPAPLFPRNQPLPRLLDVGISDAQDQLTQAGFRVKVTDEEPDPRAPKGKVTWQDPPPGTLLPAGATVILTPSAGPAQIPIPDVVDLNANDARRVLQVAGFTVREDSVASGSEAGVVVGTRPASGSAREAGAEITLIISQGPAPVNVPSLEGMTVAQARQALGRVGLRIGRISSRAGGGAPGVVLEQNPRPGSRLGRDRDVDLVISSQESNP